MESLVKKLFLIGSATLAIAVTLTSVSTQAFECDAAGEAAGTCTNDADGDGVSTVGIDSTFKFNVAEAIGLTGVRGGAIVANSLEGVNTTSAEGSENTITAQVYSNVPFQISLSAAENNGALVGQNDATRTIAPGSFAPDYNASAASSAMWGIQGLDINKAVTGDFQALTTGGSTFYSSYTQADKKDLKPAAGASDGGTEEAPTINGEDFSFPFGVVITPSTAADTYSTTVKVTVSYGI